MKTVELGRTGEQVSQLSLGCMIMGTSTDEPTAVRMLDHYVEAGGNFLDTANCYCWWHQEGSLGGESEELLGRWLQRTGRREDVFLATKGSGHGLGSGRRLARRGGRLGRSPGSGSRAPGRRRCARPSTTACGGSAPTTSTCTTCTSTTGPRRWRRRWRRWPASWPPARPATSAGPTCGRGGWSGSGSSARSTGGRRRWPCSSSTRTCAGGPGSTHSSIVDDEQLDYLREHDDLTLVAYSPILKGIYDSADQAAGPLGDGPLPRPGRGGAAGGGGRGGRGGRGHPEPGGAGLAAAVQRRRWCR